MYVVGPGSTVARVGASRAWTSEWSLTTVRLSCVKTGGLIATIMLILKKGIVNNEGPIGKKEPLASHEGMPLGTTAL